jgi:uncharacterized protein
MVSKSGRPPTLTCKSHVANRSPPHWAIGNDRGVAENSYVKTARTVPSRKPERVSYDRELAHAILDEGLVCHLGFVADGAPVVLPQLYVRDGDVLYLHGSSGARSLLSAARGGGLEVCVTVTMIDGFVLARSAFNHSVNYRSIVVHGTATVIHERTAKMHALETLVNGIVPDRWSATRHPITKELAATTVLRLPLVEVSVKVRAGDPIDEPEDADLPYWAGVLPMALTALPPQPAADLSSELEIPDHVAAWSRG